MPKTTAVVTGASSGLCKAISDRLAQAGFRGIGTSRLAPDSGDIAKLGVTMTRLDVREAASVAALRDRLAAARALPSVIVLNAGFGGAGAIEETSVDAVQAQLDTNFVGAYRVVQAFLPDLRNQSFGPLVFIGSLPGRIALPFQGIYSASKAALAAYAAALRIELRPFGVKVALVEPGDHRAGFLERRARAAEGLSSAYEPQQSRVLAAMVASEESGASPESLDDAVLRLVQVPGPGPGLCKASRFERLFVLAHQVLPTSLFQQVLRRGYGLA